MADLFHRINQPFALAHVHFGLRGTESDDDAVFVKNSAERYGVPFHLTHVNTAVVAAEQGISVQMAARELRYTWFARLLTEYPYACVATAHHQNDVLETMLLNLTRGTGLAGLHGIAARQNGIVRPLLFATRHELAVYAHEHRLTYREDSSNAEDKYARNRIRHHVVPVLTDLNPGLWQTLPRTVERLRAAETLVRAELNRSWQAMAEPLGDRTMLPTDKLLALPELAFQLSEWLKPFGFTGSQVEQMIGTLSRQTGQVFSSATHRVTHDRVTRERDGLLLEPLPVLTDYEIVLTNWPDAPVDVAGRFMLRVEQIEKTADFRPSTDSAVACFDADQLSLPLTIRPWRLGDRLKPLGMNGSKLVSDLLNDLKVGRSEREQTAVLLSGNQIAWVIGRRMAHFCRLTDQTRRLVRITLFTSTIT